MKHLFFLLFFLTPKLVGGQSYFSDDSLNNYLQGALLFLEQNQEKETVSGKKYAGEWPGEMELTTTYFFIGRKQKARDSNCFTVAAIHNFLAEIYLADTSLSSIKPMLRKAFEEIKTYENEQKFNFWKKLPPNKKLSFFKNPDTLHFVSRPTNYKLRSRFINNMANVPADADDSSLGNLAIYYQNEIFDQKMNFAKAEIFDKWQDLNRKNKHWYNYMFLHKNDTKAFLTWLHPEHSYKKWSLFKMAFNTVFIFLPGSTAGPKPYKPWVPFGANDVDVVVNSNILSYLAITNQLNSSKVAPEAASLLNSLKEQDFYWDEAIYYPNSFHTFYAWARAFRHNAGISNETALQLQTDLEKLQHEDGSYHSSRYLTGDDIIQSTAYALHAMLDLKEKGMNVSEEHITKALRFLLHNSIHEQNIIHWKGGVFFSGGTVLRNILLWKSNAYTTALIARCIQKYQNCYY